MSDDFYILADVGGTNTRVAIGSGGAVDRASICRYPSQDYPSLEAILRDFITETGVVATRGAIAVAGPVRDGVAELTNIGWRFDNAQLAAALGLSKLLVINDLQAQGFALGHLARGDVRPILAGTATGAGQTSLVVGVGTGFNASPVFETSAGRFVAPAECGHASLPTPDPDSAAFAEHMRAAKGFASIEDAVSGPGLGRIYTAFTGERTPTAEILGMAASDQQASRALGTFVRLLGTVMGDLALAFLPFGGIYLTGGMSRAVTPYLGRFGLEKAFRVRGKLSGLMESFPISVIEDDYAALAGLAAALES